MLDQVLLSPCFTLHAPQKKNNAPLRHRLQVSPVNKKKKKKGASFSIAPNHVPIGQKAIPLVLKSSVNKYFFHFRLRLKNMTYVIKKKKKNQKSSLRIPRVSCRWQRKKSKIPTLFRTVPCQGDRPCIVVVQNNLFNLFYLLFR